MTRPREQAVLARLALAAPRAVSVDSLIDDVWGDRPPPTAKDALRVHVSNLRKLLAGGDRSASQILQTAPSSYRLDVPADAVDVGRVEAALECDDHSMLRDLLSPWPEHDLGAFDAGTGYFESVARRIDDLLVGAAELVASADLDDGRADAAVALLEQAVRRHPYRERLWAMLGRALMADDRRAEALRAFQRGRRALTEVGVDPGPTLAAAEAAVFAEMAAPADRELATRYVDVDGSRIAFGTIGAGSVDLLFLHGGFVPFDTMGDTPRLAAFLDELALRFRVVLVDRRGIGMSDGTTDGSPITLDHWVADCRSVLDAVGSRRVVVFGHEHAGPVAIRLAAELPDRVVGLVLHSTAARPLRSADHPYGPTDAALERLDRMIDQLPGSEDMLRIVAPSVGEDRQLRAWLDRVGRLGANPARARELHRLYLHADVRDVLGDVKAPAAVLHPARLVRTDPGQARFLASRMPDAELVLLDSADHLFWLADADAVLAAIDRLAERSGTVATATPPPARLRAIVAVVPTSAVDVLAAHGAEASVFIHGAVVATYESLAAARRAAAAVARIHPDAAVVVDVADTTGAATDDALAALAATLTRERT